MCNYQSWKKVLNFSTLSCFTLLSSLCLILSYSQTEVLFNELILDFGKYFCSICHITIWFCYYLKNIVNYIVWSYLSSNSALSSWDTVHLAVLHNTYLYIFHLLILHQAFHIYLYKICFSCICVSCNIFVRFCYWGYSCLLKLTGKCFFPLFSKRAYVRLILFLQYFRTRLWGRLEKF